MAIESPVGRRFRVGLVVLIALVFLMFGVLMVGRRAHLFTSKLPYQTRFESAAGLVPGNPVRLNGVTVGNVLEVNLSPDPADQSVRVIYEVDRKVAPRLRTGTRASIKTIGLLGDKYVELSGGAPGEPVVPPEGEITAAKGAGLDELLAGSGDLLTDLGGIARSLKSILGGMEKGGVGQSLTSTLASLSDVLGKVNRGESLAGKLLADRRYGEQTGQSLTQAVNSLRNVFARIERDMASGTGILPALLSDPEGKKKVYDLVDRLSDTAASLAAATKSLNSGQGALATLLHNEKFSNEFTGNLRNLSRRLDSIARKLDEGQGTVGKLINDPAIFDAANHLVVGVDESALLRWLIRNRQRSGIRKKYRDARTQPAPSEPPDGNDLAEEPPAPPPAPSPTPTPNP
ncbi:MAG TPA: MlaD family protein [Thermoanaerobaculia bacterium]|jgi:phospholipid/cholesterol/gamma-HCH transport system substrate-binding protein|nr:MlaD family protein [Thermoanaerobaculia bacterium]